MDLPAAMLENFGVFLGYLDHAPAMRLANGGKFSARKIEESRQIFRNQCTQLAPKPHSGEFYRPEFAMSFGHWDDIAIMLVDDPAIAPRLTCGASQVEKYCLGVPYRPESLGTSPKIFEDARVMLDKVRSADPEYPLISVTHLKLSGLLTLAYGGHLQAAAASLIANRIQDLIIQFRRTTLREHHQPLFGDSDFERISVLLLDTFAAEDLIVVTQCNNYSVAATLVAAIRKLTVNDLLQFSHDTGQTLAESLVEDRFFTATAQEPNPERFLKDFCELATGGNYSNSKATGLDRLSGNHIIAGSYTTLGVSLGLNASADQSASKISGRVLPRGQADVNPGHELDIESFVAPLKGDLLPDVTHKIQLASNYWHFIETGKHDFRIDIIEQSLLQDTRTFETCRFISVIQSLFRQGDSNGEPSESGFQDISTTLSVPIPRIGEVRSGDCGGYRELSRMLEPGPREDHVNVMFGLEKVSDDLAARFNLQLPSQLLESFRKIGLNNEAQQSVVRVFSDFVAAMRDPLLFDSVVDMVDAYAALLDYVPDALKQVKSAPKRRQYAATLNYRRFVIEYVRALKQAYACRVVNSTAKHEEWRGDVAGSFTKLLSAGDPALKCSMAILRQRMFPEDERFRAARSYVTGVVSPDLNQRATASFSCTENYNIGIIRVDKEHVFKPDMLARVLHEAAHLYFQRILIPNEDRFVEVLLDGGEGSEWLTRELITSSMLRASEVFSDLFVFEYIFASDTDSFVKYQLQIINDDAGEASGSETITPSSLILAMVEQLYRLFLTVRYARSDADDSLLEIPLEKHRDDFAMFFESAIPHLDIRRFVSRNDLLDISRTFSSRLYSQSFVVCRFLRDSMRESRLACNLRLSQSSGQRIDYAAFEQEFEHYLRCGISVPFITPNELADEGSTVFNLINYYIRKRQKNANLSGVSVSSKEEAFCQFTVVVKSLWHVSTRQRRRRFHDLVVACSPKTGS